MRRAEWQNCDKCLMSISITFMAKNLSDKYFTDQKNQIKVNNKRVPDKYLEKKNKICFLKKSIYKLFCHIL